MANGPRTVLAILEKMCGKWNTHPSVFDFVARLSLELGDEFSRAKY